MDLFIDDGDDDDDDTLVKNGNGFMSPSPSSHTTGLELKREYSYRKVSQVKTISVEAFFGESKM